MIAAYVDSNVLIRFLTRDHPEMAERARLSLVEAAEGRLQLLLTPVVLAEVVWTLKSFYKYERKQIADGLLSLLTFQGLEVVDRDVLSIALSIFGDKAVAFGDALVAAYALSEGPKRVCTFDQDFERIPGLSVLRPGTPVGAEDAR